MTEWLKDRSTIIVNKPQRPLVTLPTIIADSEFTQLQFWTMYLSDLSTCGEDIGKMSHIINCYLDNSEISIHISSVHNYHLDWDHLDMLAHSLWPRDGTYDRSESFQINTSAAGDCLPSSISILVAGTEFHTRELRTCMTIEAISNHN